mmetsp:Transcript_45139/g.139261  ORF Transcript_45139/g.139261 Transcript_45139/m.139261 type:complete len:205 (-) Transcript_45139:381-995(-)
MMSTLWEGTCICPHYYFFFLPLAPLASLPPGLAVLWVTLLADPAFAGVPLRFRRTSSRKAAVTGSGLPRCCCSSAVMASSRLFTRYARVPRMKLAFCCSASSCGERRLFSPAAPPLDAPAAAFLPPFPALLLLASSAASASSSRCRRYRSRATSPRAHRCTVIAHRMLRCATMAAISVFTRVRWRTKRRRSRNMRATDWIFVVA